MRDKGFQPFNPNLMPTQPHAQMGGLGSMVHNHGAVLGLALATGRVLLYEFDAGHAWHDARWCAGGLPFDACYFRPATNCTAAHAAAANGAAGVPLFDWRVPGQERAPALRFYRNESYHGVDTYAVLPQFRALIAASPIDSAKWHYWCAVAEGQSQGLCWWNFT